MIDLGNKLKELRLNKSLTQVQVASRIGISKSRISSYEMNTNEPSLDILIKLASLYNVSVDSLLGLEKGNYVDVSGLNHKQIAIIQSIIESYRER
jgi:transcriptional regulator with XRE-family HTH domain